MSIIVIRTVAGVSLGGCRGVGVCVCGGGVWGGSVSSFKNDDQRVDGAARSSYRERQYP